MLPNYFVNYMLNNLKIYFQTKKMLFNKLRCTVLTTFTTSKMFEMEKLFLLLI